jgi:type II secretory pathway pseudopilin PulG
VWHALVAGNKGAAETQMANISDAIQMYVIDHRTLPDSIDNLTEPSKTSNEPYMKEIPNDPWGQRYDYKVVNKSRKEFQISSAGEDKMWGTEDDLVWPKKQEGTK